jgi:hypothetical protein
MKHDAAIDVRQVGSGPGLGLTPTPALDLALGGCHEDPAGADRKPRGRVVDEHADHTRKEDPANQGIAEEDLHEFSVGRHRSSVNGSFVSDDDGTSGPE